VRSGDQVIIFDPAYDSYAPAIKLAGGHAVHIPMLAPKFEIDWNRVTDEISAKTRMIILNSPHNPTGSTLDADDMLILADLVRDTDIILLGDEVYEHIIFDGRTHESLLRSPELSQRSLIISSFGKTCHATGWKVGYCVAPPGLMSEFRKIHQFVQFCVATPLQYALADFLAARPEHYLNLPRFYEEKRDHFCALLASSRFTLTPSAGTYFQLVDYSRISSETDTEFAQWLTREVRVASIPISVFYETPPKQNLLRFCFAKDPETLEKAAEILCKI
jgi:methionine aminotransferase